MVSGGWMVAVFGARCGGCGERLSVGERAALCGACREAAARVVGLRWLQIAGGTLPVGAGWVYGGAVAEAIGAMKFQGRPPRVGWLMEGLPDRLGALAPAADTALVAVPPQRERLRRRGFHLPDMLARALGQRAGRRVLFALRRLDRNPPRARCPEGLPRLRARGRGRGQRVLLVDDVVTTGATLRLAHEALRGAGFAVVGALCLADARPERGAGAT